MTTPPAPAAPTLTLTTDQDNYLVGATITVTADYMDAQSSPTPLVISETMTDAEGNTVSASVTVNVLVQASQQMTGTPTDTAGDTYTEVSNVLNPDGSGTATYTTVAAAPPAA